MLTPRKYGQINSQEKDHPTRGGGGGITKISV